MMKKAALFIGLLITTQVFAQALPIIKPNTPYGNVRVQLIKSGWTPVKQNEPCGSWCNMQRSNGYYETENCADTGFAPCIFVYKNTAGKHIEVLTKGEDLRFNGFR